MKLRIILCCTLFCITSNVVHGMLRPGTIRKKPSAPKTTPTIPIITTPQPEAKPVSYKKQKIGSLMNDFSTTFGSQLNQRTQNALVSILEGTPEAITPIVVTTPSPTTTALLPTPTYTATSISEAPTTPTMPVTSPKPEIPLISPQLQAALAQTEESFATVTDQITDDTQAGLLAIQQRNYATVINDIQQSRSISRKKETELLQKLAEIQQKLSSIPKKKKAL